MASVKSNTTIELNDKEVEVIHGVLTEFAVRYHGYVNLGTNDLDGILNYIIEMEGE